MANPEGEFKRRLNRVTIRSGPDKMYARAARLTHRPAHAIMTSKPISLLILGAGRLAVDVADMVADIEDVTVAGYVEGINRARCTSGSPGLPVHWIDDIASLAAGHKAVAAIGDPRRRAAILKMEEMGFEFVTLVHPTAHLARSVERGIGTVVGSGAVLAAAVVVGRHVSHSSMAVRGKERRQQ